MPTDDFQSGGINGLIGSFTDCVVGLGKRVLVHVSGIVLGVMAAVTFTPSADIVGAVLSSIPAFLCAYTGFICLVPRGISNHPDWIIPTACGFVQLCLWMIFGVPWAMSLFFGGLTTWVIRLAVKRGMMDWEWSVLPLILISMFGFFKTLVPVSGVSPLYITFPVLAAAGWAGVQFYNKLKGDTSQKEMLLTACTRLERMLQAKTLPLDLEGSVHQLSVHGRRLLEVDPRMDQKTAPLVREVCKVSATLAHVGKNLSPMGSAKAQAKLGEINDAMQKTIKSFEPDTIKEITASLDKALVARLQGYEQLAQKAVEKSYGLPPEMQVQVRGIARATDNIITCMKEDPQDVNPGDKFLSRYLNSVQTVIDEHIRLAAQTDAQNTVADTLQQSRELLARLEKAFVEEHAKLLQNDTVNYTAELNVLDKLLKMDGK